MFPEPPRTLFDLLRNSRGARGAESRQGSSTCEASLVKCFHYRRIPRAGLQTLTERAGKLHHLKNPKKIDSRHFSTSITTFLTATGQNSTLFLIKKRGGGGGGEFHPKETQATPDWKMSCTSSEFEVAPGPLNPRYQTSSGASSGTGPGRGRPTDQPAPRSETRPRFPARPRAWWAPGTAKPRPQVQGRVTGLLPRVSN